MLNAAIWGVGRWGQTLVDSVQGKSDVIRFTDAVARTPAKYEAFARSRGLRLHDDPAAVLDNRDVDALVIATALRESSKFRDNDRLTTRPVAWPEAARRHHRGLESDRRPTAAQDGWQSLLRLRHCKRPGLIPGSSWFRASTTPPSTASRRVASGRSVSARKIRTCWPSSTPP